MSFEHPDCERCAMRGHVHTGGDHHHKSTCWKQCCLNAVYCQSLMLLCTLDASTWHMVTALLRSLPARGLQLRHVSSLLARRAGATYLPMGFEAANGWGMKAPVPETNDCSVNGICTYTSTH